MVDPFDGEPLPATGTAHGHVRLKNGLLARIAFAYEGDASAAGRLHAQATAFRYLAPAGRTPRLHEVVEPRPGLPGGALIVDYVEGHVPHLPDELGAMAETLARLHSLPTDGAPLTRQADPFRETLAGIEQNAARFLDKAVTDPASRAEIADELRLMREMAAAIGQRLQPLTVALADTHPGNFIVDRTSIAWFVDLEKVHVGSPAIDLAHASLPTSTLWAATTALSADDVQRFYAMYLAGIAPAAAEALRPWLVPMRRLTWLRTTLFMARWRVQTRLPHDPADPSQWSDAGLSPAMRAAYDTRIDQSFAHDTIRAIRAGWGH